MTAWTWWPPIPRCRPPTRAYRAAILAAGFRPIEEIQPSRHRVTLPLGGAAADPRRRRGHGTATIRPDAGAGRRGGGLRGDRQVHPPADPRRRARRGQPSSGTTRGSARMGQGRALPTRPRRRRSRWTGSTACSSRPGERRHFSFGPRSGVRGLVAGGAGRRSSRLPGGAGARLVAGGPRERRSPGWSSTGTAAGCRRSIRPTTRRREPTTRARSTCCAGGRSSWPSARAARRWTSAVSTSPASRDEPREGDPLYGLYQHKRAFGGRWLELTGAHERVFDRRGYALGRLAGRLSAMLRR